ncbi:MAG: hypothetical protein E7496_09520 [Ruminococcus sp.]|nr:hypothetical protein [Ruminococcus sp.]
MKKKKSRHRKQQKYQFRGELSMPWIAPAVGGLSLLFCLVMMILSIRDKQFSLIIIFSLFAMLGVFLILTVNWKITYDSNGFTYRNYLRQSKYYRYSEITKIYRDKTSCIYIGRKKIKIDSMVAGDYLFLTHLELHTPQAKHLSAKERKLFNGNICNPEEFVFLYFLLFAIFGALVTAMFVDSRNMIFSLEALNHETVTLSNCQEEHTESDEIYLKLIPENSDNCFILTNPDSYGIKDGEILSAIENQEIFEIYYHVRQNDEKAQNIVWQLSAGEKIFLSAEDKNWNRIEPLLLSGGILLLWILFGFVGNHVLSHADRYPNAIKWFVKEDYIIRK